MGLVSHTPAQNACNCRLLYKSCSASSVRSGLYAWRWVPAVLIPHSYTECCVFPHYISNRSFSFFPVTLSLGPVTPRPPRPLCLSQRVSPLFPSLLLHPSIPPLPSLFCPCCLFLSLYRTPNVSSNGNPGYESLPLTDRQSPPPSVSSSVLVTPSQSVPFYRCS